jgi:hypothetical protein
MNRADYGDGRGGLVVWLEWWKWPGLLLLIELSLRRPGDFLSHIAGEFAQRDIVAPLRMASPRNPRNR